MAKSIVLFASGAGSNARNIIQHFSAREDVVVSALFTDNGRSGVIQLGMECNIQVHVFNYKRDMLLGKSVLRQLAGMKPELIVLAGFLRLVPADMIRQFPGKMINLHPALLPSYGGKGYYGIRVHEAVIANKEPQSGITIHYVSEHYDQGMIISQTRIDVAPGDSAESLQMKIKALEHTHYPRIIDQLLVGKHIKA